MRVVAPEMERSVGFGPGLRTTMSVASSNGVGVVMTTSNDNQSAYQSAYHVTADHAAAITSLQHSHWSGKEEHAPFIVHIMVGLFITAVGVVAVVGNVLVVVTCVRYKDLRTRSNILIINLAVGDLLMCVIDFPLLAIASFLQGWPFGFIVCRMYAFLTAVAGLVTINTLGVISADRYWAVVWRASPRQQMPKYVTGLIVLGVWLYAVSWAICPILGWGDYVLDGIGTTCTFDYLTRSWTNRSFVIAMVLGNFVVPFVTMLFSYTQIWLAVCNVKRGLQEYQGRPAAVGGKNHNGKKLKKLSVTSEWKGEYYSSSTISDSNVSCKRFYKLSEGGGGGHEKNFDGLLSKSKTYIHENNNLFQTKEEERDRKIGVAVSPRTSQHKDLIIFSFRKNAPKDNIISDGRSGPLGHLTKVSKKGNGNNHEREQQCARFTFPNFDKNDTTSSTTETKQHSHDNGQTTKHHHQQQYYLVRNSSRCSIPRKESTINNNSTLKNYDDDAVSDRKNARISFSYYQKAISDKLFLKQHRYRLHCEYKTMKIIMYLLLAFVLSWFPYVVISIMGLFGDASRITYLTSVFPSLVAKTSMVFNPILYSISHPKVRKRILHLCYCSRYRRHDNHNNNNNDGGGDARNSGGVRHFHMPFSSSISYSR